MSASNESFSQLSHQQSGNAPSTGSMLFVAVIGIAFSWYYGALYFAEMAQNTDALALHLMEEDFVIEYIQALSYLIGFGLCVVALFKRSHIMLAAGWAVLCFLFLGEEISWGQRIIGFSVPAVEAHNVQGEFTLHNMEFVTFGGIREATDFKSFMLALLDIQSLFQKGFYFYFYLIPLAMFIPALSRLATKLGYVKPTLSLTIIGFALIFASYVVKMPMQDEVFINAVVEGRETAFAGIIAVYLYQSLFQSKQAR